MPFLFDTCAASELVSTRPNLKARSMLVSLPREEIYFSIITVGEVHAGIEEMVECPKRTFLEGWFEEHLLTLYRERTFWVDHDIALRWGTLKAELRKRGKNMPHSDSLIAATALTHDLTVVTANESDFALAGVRILNPWK